MSTRPPPMNRAARIESGAPWTPPSADALATSFASAATRRVCRLSTWPSRVRARVNQRPVAGDASEAEARPWGLGPSSSQGTGEPTPARPARREGPVRDASLQPRQRARRSSTDGPAERGMTPRPRLPAPYRSSNDRGPRRVVATSGGVGIKRRPPARRLYAVDR
jgi:hypothetical protein